MPRVNPQDQSEKKPPLKLLQKTAFIFSIIFSISLAITNTLYASLYIESAMWILVGILMAISNIISTVMTVYNMTNKVGEHINFESSLFETIQDNIYTKTFASIIAPSLLLHWLSTAISSYTSMTMLGTALNIGSIGTVCLGVSVSIIALCATCALNLTQAHDTLYKLATVNEYPQEPQINNDVTLDPTPTPRENSVAESPKVYRHMFSQTDLTGIRDDLHLHSAQPQG